MTQKNYEPGSNDRTGESIVLEGITSVCACIKALDEGIPSRCIKEVLVDSQKASGGSDRARRRISYFRAKAEEYGFCLRLCESEEISVLASGNTHGGILAIVSPRKIKAFSASDIVPDGFYMLFDGVEDPYTLGYSLRSLYAAGADGVILPAGHLISADGIISRASAGAYELLSVFCADGGAVDAVEKFRSCGYRALCSGLRNSTPYLSAGLCRPLLIVMGGEKRGISSALTAACDGSVRIDYGRPFLGSLSTACAVSVLSFEVLRNSPSV